MITQTVIMQPNLPDTFLTFLNNGFKNSFEGISSVSIEQNEVHTAVTLVGDNINSICKAIFQLGQEDACFIYKIKTDTNGLVIPQNFELEHRIWNMVHNWCYSQKNDIPDHNRRLLMDEIKQLVESNSKRVNSNEINRENLLEIGFKQYFPKKEELFFRFQIDNKFHLVVDSKTSIVSLVFQGTHIQKLEHIKTIEQIKDFIYGMSI